MIQIKESFQGQRVLTLPDSLLGSLCADPLVANLYIRKIGFFPKAKYHSVSKPQGCPYSLLLHCTEGRGWYETGGRKHIIPKDSFVILPAGMPYSFGSDNSDPWTIYFVHFCGALAPSFAAHEPVRGSVEPADNSRIGERLRLFEELYGAFSQAMVPGHMAYASMCLGHYLASFTMLEQYRHMAGSEPAGHALHERECAPAAHTPAALGALRLFAVAVFGLVPQCYRHVAYELLHAHQSAAGLCLPRTFRFEDK